MIRATKVELFRFCSDVSAHKDDRPIDVDRREAWKQLSVFCQQMTNRLWQMWLCYHTANESAEKMRAHLDAYASWKQRKEEAGKAKATFSEKPPVFPVQCVPSALQNSMYKDVSRRFPKVNVRTTVLLMNKWRENLAKRKAANGSLPGWLSILFSFESLPSCTHPIPIPFDAKNCEFTRVGDKIVLQVRIERLDSSTKKAKASVVESCELMINKRKSGGVRQVINRIVDGEYTFKGSSLVFDRRSGKWFASIAYDMPTSQKQGLDAGRTLKLIPGKRSPWVVLYLDGKKRDAWRIGGNGTHVENFRRRIQRERIDRKESYRWAGSNQKGHGRRRATEVWTKLSSNWRNFTQRYNNEMTRKLVELCVSRRIGNLVYCQPADAGSKRDSLYLSRAGNDGRNAMSWDYFQVKTMLAHKCKEYGIEFSVPDASRLSDLRKAKAAKGKRRVAKKAANLP